MALNNKKVSFKIGSNLSKTNAQSEGSFVLDQQNGNLFIDISSTNRLQIKDDTKVSLDSIDNKGTADTVPIHKDSNGKLFTTTGVYVGNTEPTADSGTVLWLNPDDAISLWPGGSF